MKKIDSNHLLEEAKKSAKIRIRRSSTFKFAEGDLGNHFEIETNIKQCLSRFSKEELLAYDEEVRKFAIANRDDKITDTACAILRRIINTIAYPQPSMYAKSNNTSAELGC